MIARDIQKMIDFGIDYFGQVGAILVPSLANLAVSGAILGPNSRQLGPQEASWN